MTAAKVEEAPVAIAGRTIYARGKARRHRLVSIVRQARTLAAVARATSERWTSVEVDRLVVARLVQLRAPDLVRSLVLAEAVGDAGADPEIEVVDRLERFDQLLRVEL